MFRVKREHIFHCRDKLARYFTDASGLLLPGFELVFFST
jgi:hypothetical protein